MSNNTYWSEQSFLRLAFISDESWKKIFSNFLSYAGGDPLQNIEAVLEDEIARLTDMGLSQPSLLAALQFALERAGDFGSLAERSREGSLGQGWSSLADIELMISPNGAISVIGLVNVDLLRALDATKTAQYAVSLSLDMVVGQEGLLVDGSSFLRPSFAPNLNQYTDSGMTLTVVSNGYVVTTGRGDRFIFDQDGKLTSFVSSTGEEIAVIYDTEGRIARYEDAQGNFLEFTYDMTGRVASVEEGNVRVVSYTYDGNGLLTDRVIANDNHPERSPARGERMIA